jgi:hypothetical protein
MMKPADITGRSVPIGLPAKQSAVLGLLPVSAWRVAVGGGIGPRSGGVCSSTGAENNRQRNGRGANDDETENSGMHRNYSRGFEA